MRKVYNNHTMPSMAQTWITQGTVVVKSDMDFIAYLFFFMYIYPSERLPFVGIGTG